MQQREIVEKLPLARRVTTVLAARGLYCHCLMMQHLHAGGAARSESEAATHGDLMGTNAGGSETTEQRYSTSAAL